MAAANISRMGRLFETSPDSITKSSTTKVRKTQVGTRPKRTLATCINNRVVRGIGKTFLALFTVPAMAALEALTGFVVGAAISSILVVAPIYAKTKIGAFAMAVTVTPIVTLVVGVGVGICGAIDGMRRGVLMAYDGSCEEFKELAKLTFTTKDEAKICAKDLAHGKPFAKAISNFGKSNSPW